MGVGRRGNRVYAIDYGLAKAYRYPKTQEHIPMKEGKSLTGTARYASSNTHCGLEQSRRDDLESIGYVLIYFLKGHLPWQGMQANGKKVKYDLIRDKKLSTSTSVLCRGLPIEFQVYLDYVKKLEFDATPDYRRLRKLFHDVYKKQGYQDYVFDWVVKQQKELDRTGQHVWREQLKPVAKK